MSRGRSDVWGSSEPLVEGAETVDTPDVGVQVESSGLA